ncbi:hypothetical protein PanWU01x14_256450 [Parasponia andersonii]|uniref:RNase H type-1 domain-containing protein n=1 Tax=Parasponia andersonii TaxID=3476 RepID=A0A2P5BAF1_PARAD|nr:hypothetical protein PanWU01x14_256450 [Parasponia andersonii]
MEKNEVMLVAVVGRDHEGSIRFDATEKFCPVSTLLAKAMAALFAIKEANLMNYSCFIIEGDNQTVIYNLNECHFYTHNLAKWTLYCNFEGELNVCDVPLVVFCNL